jgi:cellulose synthase/poly-beta-1,6-N-acetylglucosamine synthase-like glycosyltransferase
LGLENGSTQPVWREWSAERTLTRRQQVIGAAALLILIAAAVLNPLATLIFLAAVLTLIFFATTAVRVGYLYYGYKETRAPRTTDLIPVGALPTYTILVPLYRESNVVPRLMQALDQLSYPRDRVEVLILVEHDDVETKKVCEEHLRPGWRIVIIPAGEPRTKPRALNVGLEHATGELLTIYDAEDRPEPDQLLKAAAEFRRLPEQVAGLQARLCFYNAGQNTLTKWFACEYSVHFGFYLEGIARFRHCMPLGGTSTHFRTEVIRRVGGWDAWNVTEDCELGMRLAGAGFDCLMLDSFTWEEAVPDLRTWIRQRSRWEKGFAQTGLALLRAPVRTARSMGWRKYGSSLAVVPAVPLTQVAQLFTWALFVVYFTLRSAGFDVEPIEAVFPEPLLSLGVISLVAGNFAVLLSYVAAVYQQGRYELVRWAVLSPLYWFLFSLGAVRGMVQLIGAPHFWEKTTHGLAKGEAVGVGAGPAATPLEAEEPAPAVVAPVPADDEREQP